MSRRGNGSSIYLGKPIATPPGVFIGRPGPTIYFHSHEVDTEEGLIVDFTNITLDMTTLEVTLD